MFCWSGVSSREWWWVCVFPLSLDLSGCIIAALQHFLCWHDQGQILCESTLPQTPEGPLVWQQSRLRFMKVSQKQLPKAPLRPQWTTNSLGVTWLSLLALVSLHRLSLSPFGGGMGEPSCPTPPEPGLSPRELWCLLLTLSQSSTSAARASQAMCKCLWLFSVPIYSWMPPEYSTKPSKEPRALSLSSFTALCLASSLSHKMSLSLQTTLCFLSHFFSISLSLLNSWQEALSFLTSSHFCQVTLWVISPNK